VNVSNTIIVNNTYINNAYRGRYRDFDYRYRGRPNAVTVVDREHFVHGRPVRGDYRRLNDRELRNWGHDARPPAIAPDRESIRAAQPRMPRSWDQNRSARQVVARREVPNRVNFDAERRAIEANGGRPVARTQLIDRNPKEGSNVRIARGVRPDNQSASGAGAVGRVPDDKAARRVGRDSGIVSQRGREAGTSVNDARERASERRAGGRDRTERDASNNAVQRMQATEDATRDSAAASRESRVERSGSAPHIDAQRRQRNSSDWAEQRSQRLQQQEQSRTFEARQRDQQQRDAAREVQRAQREAATREHASPRVEPQRSEQRIERASPAPERAQPRVERSSPQPRAAPEQRVGNPKAQGSAGNHMRAERGGNRNRER
jgi:hypothetical protein